MKKVILMTFVLGIIGIACSINDALILPPDVRYVSEVGPVPDRIDLDQAWDPATKNKFWFTSQGSQIMPYDWFTWLEQPDNKKFFRDSYFMSHLGYLPMKTSKDNPSGLPIGFAMTRAKSAKDSYMGLTCAACHTNQISYRGKNMLIDGAPTLANFVLFWDNIVDALNKTHSEPDKFERFARRVLGGSYNAKTKAKLQSDLLATAIAAGQRRDVNALPDDYPEDFTSWARLDAFGNIENAGAAFGLGDLSNGNPPTAPVSYPFLWGTHQSDVVQWNASAPNTPLVGPVIRNMGEVVGVFGGLEIKEAGFISKLFGKDHTYSSTVDFHGLGALEGYVKILRSPEWPENILPKIDAAKAERGSEIFSSNCQGCHQVIHRADEGNHYKATKTPLVNVGTDPYTAWEIENHESKTLILEGFKADIVVGEKFGPTTRSLNISLNGVVGLALKNPIKALEAGFETAGIKETASWKDYVKEHQETLDSIAESRNDDDVVSRVYEVNENNPEGLDLDSLVYKARPLNGIWATAPYLHNGSVPNLWQLLQKPKDRVKKFWVGSYEFDPENVGFDTSSGKSRFKVMNNGAIMKGNSNLGHGYGTDLSDDDKWALIEYMKTL
ncbi:MAG: hypothetical protein HKO66_16580 [Saprospiraceae bacterium]|nr:hypothetical protein [Bacteroidia bacterium]NNL93862.1 hypothetical protein [Saprospiraceae bacterium]